MDTSISGSELIQTTPQCRELLLGQCAPPVEFVSRLRRRAPGGAPVLFESASFDGPLPTLRKSFVVTRALVRVELRGQQASLTPLCDEAGELIARLTKRLDAPRAAGPTGHSDDERLRAPSALDALRAVAGCVADRAPSPLPPGIFGALSYELVDHFEALGPRKPDPLGEPDASFVLAQDMVVYDHERGRVDVIVRGLPGDRLAAVRNRLDALVALLEAGEPERERVSGPPGRASRSCCAPSPWA